MSKMNITGFNRIQSSLSLGCLLLALALRGQAAPLTGDDDPRVAGLSPHDFGNLSS